MIELYQFAWSPYCIVQRRILEFARVPFKIVSVPNTDRSLVWKLTRGRYYQLPIVRDGKQVVFETGENSQVIAKYIDQKFELGLFPREWAGVQNLLWSYFENDIEGVGFKLDDIYWKEFVPKAEHCAFVRHKERKFGRGCLDQWRAQQRQLLKDLEQRLGPCEQMLATRPFLLTDRPLFVDFDLYGMLENFLYSGHYRLPNRHTQLKAWYSKMGKVKSSQFDREKLHS